MANIRKAQWLAPVVTERIAFSNLTLILIGIRSKVFLVTSGGWWKRIPRFPYFPCGREDWTIIEDQAFLRSYYSAPRPLPPPPPRRSRLLTGEGEGGSERGAESICLLVPLWLSPQPFFLGEGRGHFLKIKIILFNRLHYCFMLPLVSSSLPQLMRTLRTGVGWNVVIS